MDTDTVPAARDVARDVARDAAREAAREAAIIWPPAVAVAALGALLCIFAAPGANWGLWTLAAALGMIYVARPAGARLTPAAVVVLAAACALAFGAAVTADTDFYPVILAVTATLLAVAMYLAAGVPLSRVGARFIALAPFEGATRAVGESTRRLRDGVALARSGRDVRALRGVLIALPVVAVLALLLSAADPVLARLRDYSFQLANDSTVVPRLVFFVILGALTLGAYGIVARPQPFVDAKLPGRPRLALNDSERLVILCSVGALFAVFLALQLSYFFGNIAAIAGNGVTYATYARQGFGELTVAATISTLLVLWLDSHTERGEREGQVRLAALALVFLVQLLIDSAYHRVVLYEGAYGYTAARLYAKVYMVVVSLALIALGLEIWGALDVRRLARRVALVGVAALIALTYWNHQAWIARRNLARFAVTGQLDESYLATALSPNAVPAIVRALPTLPDAESARLRAVLGREYSGSRALRAEHWYEGGLRTRQARRALASIGIH